MEICFRTARKSLSTHRCVVFVHSSVVLNGMISTFLDEAVINRFHFYFKDILREKSNHIEQLMKEREQDREESAGQAILFKKTVDLVNILSLCRLWAFHENLSVPPKVLVAWTGWPLGSLGNFNKAKKSPSRRFASRVQWLEWQPRTPLHSARRFRRKSRRFHRQFRLLIASQTSFFEHFFAVFTDPAKH